jgi:hypothetical protein
LDDDSAVNVFQGVVIPNKIMSASTTTSGPSRDASTRGVSSEYDSPATSAFATPDESKSRVLPASQFNYAARQLRRRGPSRGASTRGVSSENSTPITSAVVTPDEPKSRLLSAGRLRHSAKDFKLGGSSIHASTKRKREEDNRIHDNISDDVRGFNRAFNKAFDFEDSDAALALHLQEAEYYAQSTSSKALNGPKSAVGKGKAAVADDTEESPLSELSLDAVC